MCYIIYICICKYIVFGRNKVLFYLVDFNAIIVLEENCICCFISCEYRVPCTFNIGNLLSYEVISVFAFFSCRILSPTCEYVVSLCRICGNIAICKNVIRVIILCYLLISIGMLEYDFGNILILDYGIEFYICGRENVFYYITCKIIVFVVNICAAIYCCPTEEFLCCFIIINFGNFRSINCFAFGLYYNNIATGCYECDCVFIENFDIYGIVCAFNFGNLLINEPTSVTNFYAALFRPTLEIVTCLFHLSICRNITIGDNIILTCLGNFLYCCFIFILKYKSVCCSTAYGRRLIFLFSFKEGCGCVFNYITALEGCIFFSVVIEVDCTVGVINDNLTIGSNIHKVVHTFTATGNNLTCNVNV